MTNSPKLPLDWFLKRVGKRILRCSGGDLDSSSYTEGLVILFKVHAEYLFECQDRGYRYEELNQFIPAKL